MTHYNSSIFIFHQKRKERLSGEIESWNFFFQRTVGRPLINLIKFKVSEGKKNFVYSQLNSKVFFLSLENKT